jgi:oligosaccharide repeat unit polymerase
MTIGLTLFAGLLTVLLGRWMFGKWFNHLALYGLSWSLSLALFHVGLIYYYPLETETWLVIGAGWSAFVLGSATIVAARFSLGRIDPAGASMPHAGTDDAVRILGVLLWIFNVVIVIEAIHHAFVISRLIGGITNFSRVANILYTLRVKQEIPGMIPYLSSAGLTACLLAGVYASRTGRLQMIWLVPPLVTTVDSVLNMSRGTMIIGGVLFASGYVTNRRKDVLVTLAPGATKVRRFIAIALALALFVAGIDFVRSTRGIVESYGTATSAIGKLQGDALVTGSVVFYATGSYGVLNQYLKKDDEQGIVGGYSFAPFWRLVAKLGFPTYVEQAQPFYMTPRPSNNGTYLRELHADYGLMGVVAGPFLLGALASAYWFRAVKSQRVMDIMILGHIYVVVAMSIFLIATQWGYWLASLLFGLGAAIVIDHASPGNKPARREQ